MHLANNLVLPKKKEHHLCSIPYPKLLFPLCFFFLVILLLALSRSLSFSLYLSFFIALTFLCLPWQISKPAKSFYSIVRVAQISCAFSIYMLCFVKAKICIATCFAMLWLCYIYIYICMYICIYYLIFFVFYFISIICWQCCWNNKHPFR